MEAPDRSEPTKARSIAGPVTPDAGVAARSAHLFDVARLPALVDRRLRRAVEPQDGEVAFAGNGSQPVPFLAARRFWTEIQVGRAVGVRHGLVARAERRERLAVGEARRVLRFVQGE